jgi:hypothetical protein
MPRAISFGAAELITFPRTATERTMFDNIIMWDRYVVAVVVAVACDSRVSQVTSSQKAADRSEYSYSYDMYEDGSTRSTGTIRTILRRKYQYRVSHTHSSDHNDMITHNI